MAGVVTTRFRYNIVDQFIEQFGEADNTNMYLLSLVLRDSQMI